MRLKSMKKKTIEYNAAQGHLEKVNSVGETKSDILFFIIYYDNHDHYIFCRENIRSTDLSTFFIFFSLVSLYPSKTLDPSCCTYHMA